MVRSIGVAFQGGGAKVVSLIAAADGISQLVADKRLAVDAISGTSAGCLAALLLSAQVDFSKIKAAIRKQKGLIARNFAKPGKITTFRKATAFMTLGQPFYRVRDFNEVLEAILMEVNIDIDKQIQEVAKVPLHIMVSDIHLGRSVALSNGGLRDVLRRSCAIPVVFASHKADDQGQYADGGIYDNMPTDVLAGTLPVGVPVFAVGFQPDRFERTKSAFDYLTSVIGSVVTNNVVRSTESIGSDHVCRVATKLTTLDFDKMVSVGLDEEYDSIKAGTIAFFEKWLHGEGGNSTQSAGQRASSRLKDVERKLVDHVEGAFRAVTGRYEYVNMSVVANSLENPHVADDITIEHLLVVPDGHCLQGIILPFLGGSGSTDRIECVVRVEGPEGAEIDTTQFVINDEVRIHDSSESRNSVAILFSNHSVDGRYSKLYIVKRETRFGFMAPLRSGFDSLALSSSYWPADTATIRMSTPPEYRNMTCDWACANTMRLITAHPVASDTPRIGWSTVSASVAGMQRSEQFKGLFTHRRRL